MKVQEIIGYCLFPLICVTVAVAISQYELWSVIGNYTIPWFCSAIAVAQIVVGVVCILSQRPACEIPTRVSTTVTVLAALGLCFGYFVDHSLYFPKAQLWMHLSEALGFSLILGLCFWFPKTRSA